MILNGSKKMITFKDLSTGKEAREIFEGVIPSLQRQYSKTDSFFVRDKISSYISEKTCNACNGHRLNETARNVFVDDMTLPEISELKICDSLDIISNLKFSGNKEEIGNSNLICKFFFISTKFLV